MRTVILLVEDLPGIHWNIVPRFGVENILGDFLYVVVSQVLVERDVFLAEIDLLLELVFDVVLEALMTVALSLPFMKNP